MIGPLVEDAGALAIERTRIRQRVVEERADRLAYLHQSDLVWTHLARRDSMDDHVIAPVERLTKHGDRKG